MSLTIEEKKRNVGSSFLDESLDGAIHNLANRVVSRWQRRGCR